MIEDTINQNTVALEANTAMMTELTELLKASRDANTAEALAEKAEKPVAKKKAPAKKAPAKKKTPVKEEVVEPEPEPEPEPEVAEQEPEIKTLDDLRSLIQKKRKAFRASGDADRLEAFAEGFKAIKEDNCYDKLGEIPSDEIPEFIADVVALLD